jgi:predicted alpha/beta-hydrolase family hydrolase
MNTVIFAHGKESGPWGRKSCALAETARRHGWRFVSPDFSGMSDPEKRVKNLLAAERAPGSRLVLVGSSMGGYVALQASASLAPAALLLLAPAVYIPGYPEQDPVPHAGKTLVVHGWRDRVIPPEHAWRFARRHSAELYLVDDDHPLAGSIPFLQDLFTRLLTSLDGGRRRLVSHL